jgi:hypothetical protein
VVTDGGDDDDDGNDDGDDTLSVPVHDGKGDRVHRVFLDGTGTHTVVAMTLGDFYYVHNECRDQPPVKLSR